MTSKLSPFKLYGKSGPNPRKVAVILEELGLDYDIVDIPLTDIKKPEYTAVNPNGRLPSIYDPNTDITVWESGAIIEYLMEFYDQEHKLSFAPRTPESIHAKQWLYFQTTGQGPMYGQLSWFVKYHPEQLPSAVERYSNEVKRVSSVLEGYLAEQKKRYNGDGAAWLVGNKMSYADLAFVPWQKSMAYLGKRELYNEEDFPHVKAWLNKMIERESFKKVFAGRGPFQK